MGTEGSQPLSARLEQVDRRLQELESLSTPEDRIRAVEALKAVLSLHGQVLARLLEQIGKAPDGDRLLDSLAGDPEIRGLLLLHGVHPHPLARRVEDAMDSVRPYLRSHGGEIQLVSLEGGVVRVSLQGSCRSCPSSSETLKYAVEDALLAFAPDLVGTEVDVPAGPGQGSFVPLTTLSSGTPIVPSRWQEVARLEELEPGAATVVHTLGSSLLVLRQGQQCWAFGADCPRCHASLSGARLRGDLLACPTCSAEFQPTGAGRCADGQSPGMLPLPLLLREGSVRVALQALVA